MTPTDKERDLVLVYRNAPEEIRRWLDAVLKPYIGAAKFLGAYRQINDRGKERVMDYADTLVSSGKYNTPYQGHKEDV